MLSVMARNELLERAEELHRKRDYRQLAQLLAGRPESFLFSEPELAHLLALAWSQLDRSDKALDLVLKLSDLFGDSGNDRMYRRRLNVHGVCLLNRGDLDGAEALFHQVVTASSSADDQHFLASATTNLGVVADIRCQWERAVTVYQRAIVAFQRIGDRAAIGGCHHNLGMAYRQLGLLSCADSHFENAIGFYQPNGTPEELATTEVERSLLFLTMGDQKRADVTSRRLIMKARQLGNLRLEGEAYRVLGMVAMSRRRAGEARMCLLNALSAARASGTRMLEAEVQEELAVLEEKEGSRAMADMRLREAEKLFAAFGAEARAHRARSRIAKVS